MSPGPSFLFVAQTTLNKSRNHGITTSLGLSTGAVIFTLLACFGLFVVLESAPFLYGTLKFIGGLYLLYLAYKIWRSSNDTNQSVTDKHLNPNSKKSDLKISSKEYLKYYFLGLMTQLSNPKTAIVIGSMIMAFLPHEVPPYSFLIIAVLTMFIDFSWYIIVSISLSTKKMQKLYDRFKQRINRIASGLMAFMGTKLALTSDFIIK